MIRMLIFGLLLLLFPGASMFSQSIKTELKDNWQFKNQKSEIWYPAIVPGTVHTDLYANNIIPNPFYGLNEEKIQWIEKQNWEYRTVFDLSDEVFEKENIELIFNGLDTYAQVRLNDSLILNADNMFRTWNIECKHLLKKKNNKLEITFYSPIVLNKSKLDSLSYQLPAGNDRAFSKVSVYTRKAPYHFGWDWAPRFVTCGIWRPIEILAWNNVFIEKMQIVQKTVDTKKAVFNVLTKLEVSKNENVKVRLLCNDEIIKEKHIYLKKGEQRILDFFEINNPKLWWVNGFGEPYLYNFKIEIIKNKHVIASKSVNFGIRTLEIVQESDSTGKSFFLKLNGVPIFIKGANYIPQDIFLPNVSPEKYQNLIKSAKVVNMNMLRVWGGGIYENDEFYDLCDENGILVWQDFMFSCSMYPGDSAFLANIEQESIDNVVRLRNHPSLAIWCGNNEMQVAWERWGYQKSFGYSKIDSAKIYNDYLKLFDTLLPKIINENDSGRFYWPSSPNSAPSGWKEEAQSGDMHYWGVWWGKEPFFAYNDFVGRFMSEYGFQSIPALSTLKSFCSDTSLYLISPELKSHNKHSIGFETIDEYMKRDFNSSENFDDYILQSQILQAEGMKIAIEAHRRAKPFCMGTLYWQLNDCWPVVSWSSIDYFGRWKAFHYYLYKLYAPVMVSPIIQNDKIVVYLISDLIEKESVKMKVVLYDFYGQTLWEYQNNIVMKANSSDIIFSKDLYLLLNENNKNNVFLNVEIFKNDSLIAENNMFFAKTKDLELPKAKIVYKFIEKAEKYGIEIISDAFVKCLYIEYKNDKGDFSDNYFSLIPNRKKIVWINSHRNKNEYIDNIKIKVLDF